MNITIFSLNSGGIPFSPNRKVRFDLIINHLKKEKYDFVMLQEIGERFTYNKIKKNLSHIYNFYPEKSPTLINRNGGLIFLSRKPLRSYRFHRYKLKSGPRFPYNVPEKMSSKGVQICVTQAGASEIIFLHTHLLANFFGDDDEYKYMDRQLTELVEVLNKMPKETPLILSGDLNFPPETKLYRRLVRTGNLFDPLKDKKIYTHSSKNLNISKIFVKLGLMWGDKREDYTLFRGFNKNSIHQTIFDKKSTFEGKYYDLSDHYAVLSKLTVV